MSAPATSAPGELSPEQVQVLLTPVPPWKQGALWKSIAIALVSSIVLLAIVAFILSNSTGWESFRQAFLSWPNFKAAWPLVLDGFKLRTHAEDCPEGKFLHPHDACFDRDGNIFVAEWVEGGRITKLRHVAG